MELFTAAGLSLLSMAIGLAVYEALGAWSGAKERAASLAFVGSREQGSSQSGGQWAEDAARAMLARAAKALEAFAPSTVAESQGTRECLRLAGLSVAPETWRVLRILVCAALSMTALFIAFAAGVSGIIGIVVALAGALGGWFLSDVYLDIKKKQRRELIEATLPDAMDLLGVALAAGSPVEQCFKEVAVSLKGPLSDEFALVDREVNMLGASRERALEHLSARCESQEVSAFVAQLIQAINQGSSITEGLSAQAALARECAQAAALEEIRKMPTKLDVVLSVFFLPPTTILVLVPTVVQLLKFLQTSM